MTNFPIILLFNEHLLSQCTWPFWPSLRVVGPRGGEPILFIRAEPGRAPVTLFRVRDIELLVLVFPSGSTGLLLVWPVPQDQFALGDRNKGKCPQQHSSWDHSGTQTPPLR